MSEVIIRVRVESNQAKAQTNSLEADLKNLEATAKKAGVAVDGVGTASKKTATFMDDLKNSAKGAIAAWGVVEIGRAVVQLGQMGEAAQTTRDALEGVTDSSAEATQSIELIRQVTNRSVSETQAAALATRIFGLEMADSAKEAAEFARMGGTLGQVFDKDAASGIANLSSAIANLSYERLDQLGISSGVVRQRVAELKEEGYALEEAFRLATLEQARIKVDAMEAAGVRLGTSTDRVAASWDTFATNLGTRVTPALQAASEGLTRLLDLASSNPDLMNLLVYGPNVGMGISQTQNAQAAAEASRLAAEGYALQEQAIAKVEERLNALNGADTAAEVRLVADAFVQVGREAGYSEAELISLWVAAGGTRAELVLAGDAARTTGGDFITMADSAERAAWAKLGAADAGEALAVALQWIDRVSGAAENAMGGITNEAYRMARGATTAAIALDDLVGMFNALDAVSNKAGSPLFRLEGLGSTGGGVKNILGGRVEAFRASQVEIGRIQRSGVSDAEKAAREIEQAYQRELSKIRFAAEQALNFNDAVDALDPLLDEFGLRNEQEASEFARRMRAITAEAMSGQGLTTAWKWVEMYKIEGNDLREIAANAEAARRAAVSGSDLSKLDKDAVARDVEEILANNANREAFINDIVGRVQAKTGATAAKIQEALGQSVGFAVVGAGQTASADLLNSMQAGMVAELQANRSAFEGIGDSMMGFVFDGAKASITGNNIVKEFRDSLLRDMLKLIAGQE